MEWYICIDRGEMMGERLEVLGRMRLKLLEKGRGGR